MTTPPPLLGGESTGLGSIGDVGTLERAVRPLVVVVFLGPLEIIAHGVAAFVNAGEELAEPAWLPGSNRPTAQ
jgi:hypothetical protein